MLVNYIQSIMLTVLEIICCKIFFESFAEKRSENNWRNCSIILGTVICGYMRPFQVLCKRLKLI